MGLFGALFGGSGRLSRDEVKQRVAAGAILVDVRTPAEFAAGHAAGAKNLPLQELRAKGYEKVHDAGALGNVM